MTTTSKIQPAESIHFLRDGFTYSVSDSWHSGEISRRGQTVTVTAEMITANSDREGNSFFDLVDDTAGQEQRWGHHYFGRGEFPADLPVFLGGTPGWERAREDARLAAWAVPNEAARAEALKAVNVEFGPAPSKQVSTTFRGSTALPVREQA